MSNHDNQLALAILEVIFKRRKLVEVAPSNDTPFIDIAVLEGQLHLAKLEQMVQARQPIMMILPAYPGKSPNRNKTLGKLPDLSEKHSIDQLALLCRKISEIYPPGAKICICSDGYVFADLVRIPDADVFGYTEAIKAYYQQYYPSYFDFFDIKDALPRLNDLDTMREELMVQYGESMLSLMDKAKCDKQTLSMYQGITRFLFEDFCGLAEFSDSSKTQIQKTAKQVSLRVIQRSNAWSELLADAYPNAIRLSIHPQFRQSNKIGINLGAADDGWRTPWHSVAVFENHQLVLKSRQGVNENHFRLIFNNGQPCHYRQVSPVAA